MTIEDLRTMRKKAIQQRDAKPQLQAAVDKQGEISSKLSEARAAKDVDAVIKLQAELEITNAAIKTLARDADKLQYDFSEKEVLDFWAVHVEKYNRDFDKKYQAYRQARAELCKQFSELVRMQKEIVDDRAEVRKITGITLARPAGDFREVPAPHIIKDIRTGGWTPIQFLNVEAAFYAAAGELSKDTAALFSSVITRGPEAWYSMTDGD